jgi:phosphate transport system substrate-binding protein
MTAGALALTLAACGSDDPTGSANTPAAPAAAPAAATAAAPPAAPTTGETPAPAPITGTFAGAGSSAQAKAVDAWIAAMQTANGSGLTISYDSIGSGSGREQFLAGGTAWAGSDAALKPAEMTTAQQTCGPTGAIDIPVYISPIAVAYNLPGVDGLNLSSDSIAGIFRGDITSWDDPAIAADNAGVTLPSTTITALHRLDNSGTTENFTDWLNKNAPDVWTDAGNQAWPLDGGESAEGTSGVGGVLSATEGAIAYLDESGVPGGMGIAKIEVGGTFTAISAEGAAEVVANSPLQDGRTGNDLGVAIDRTAASGYPLVLVSYMIVCQEYSDAATGTFVNAFLSYVVSAEGQAVAQQAAGSAPLSGAIATKAAAAAAAIK